MKEPTWSVFNNGAENNGEICGSIKLPDGSGIGPIPIRLCEQIVAAHTEACAERDEEWKERVRKLETVHNRFCGKERESLSAQLVVMKDALEDTNKLLRSCNPTGTIQSIEDQISANESVLSLPAAATTQEEKEQALEEKEADVSAGDPPKQNALPASSYSKRTPYSDAVAARIEDQILRHFRTHPHRCFFPSCISRYTQPETSTVVVEERGGAWVAECSACCGGTGSMPTREEALDEWNKVARDVLKGRSVEAVTKSDGASGSSKSGVAAATKDSGEAKEALGGNLSHPHKRTHRHS